MREIGSEFWIEDSEVSDALVDLYDDLLFWLEVLGDYRFLLSGRTAIDYALADMVATYERSAARERLRSAYLPSYCCSSVLQPFIDRGIEVDFYEVVAGPNQIEYIIDENWSGDVFLATSYFGFSQTTMDAAISFFRDRGVTVIEDATHRLFNGSAYCREADYVVASLRKWLPVPCGGLVIKQTGSLVEQPLKEATDLAEIKIRAMVLKGRYIADTDQSDSSVKSVFLKLFSAFDDGLRLDYRMKAIDAVSRQLVLHVNADMVRSSRRRNACVLHESLNQSRIVRPLVGSPNFAEDCPLFYPVRVRSGLRESLREWLIAHRIYCPVHWPVSRVLGKGLASKSIYEDELSVVCDQRYDVNDMTRIVDAIKEFEVNV